MTDLAPPPAITRSPGDGAVRTALRRAAPALLVYAGTRLLGLVVLGIWAAVADRDAHQLLARRWDSLWYSRIAEGGYGHSVPMPDGSVHSDLAFFPMLPWLERLGAAVSPLSAADTGLLVSAVASVFAAWALFAVGERVAGSRAGVMLVALWAALPVGVVQSMAYSESLFTALAAWGVYALLARRWVAAGVLAALAGLTRPVGAAVVAAVWITAAAELWRDAGRRRAWRREWPLLAGVALAPLGWVGYFVWVGVRTGSVTGYLDVQAGWGNGFDGGLAFAGFILERLFSPGFLAGAALLIGVGLLLWLFALGVRSRLPLPLLVYAGVVLTLALAAKGYFGSKPRLLIPAFPLLLPPAAALGRWRPARAWPVVAVVAVGSAVYGAFWLHGSGPP
ncbi:glycosyltransferase family 39 protein [Streptomyces sp. NPDC018031]|uniref:glycosyltransferase family 39 protein n=1 Tax=Streptomyces sp. NPDC018031 TaxID=3365033 RepID=UPI0037B14D0D